MHNCSRCFGEGSESFEEDGRMVTDICYHCSGSGKVDSETHFGDQIDKVAVVLAMNRISSIQRSYNNDLHSEGWDFVAAENGLSSLDYYNERVGYLFAQFANEISSLPHEMQLALIDTLCPEKESSCNNAAKIIANDIASSNEDDCIPF